MAFPTTLPSYTITAGAETANGAGGGTGLSGLLNAFEVDITALGTKIGTGASTPISSRVLRGSGTGTSAWAQVVMATDMAAFTSADILGVVSDETGTGSLVFGSSPTIVTPTIASFTNAQHNHSNAAGGGTITTAGLPTGTAIQMVYNQVATAATGTTTTPTDGTIPQNTEGDQYMTQAITPTSATSILVIEANALISYSVASKDITIALFQDSTANALAANLVFSQAVATTFTMLNIKYAMVSGTTSSTTFKIRLGAETGGGGTLSFNAGVGVSPMFGSTIPKSGMFITEYKA